MTTADLIDELKGEFGIQVGDRSADETPNQFRANLVKLVGSYRNTGGPPE
jgi:acyl carrier protein